MAFSRKENVAVTAIFLPVGIAVNALLLWGFRHQIDLTDPLFWVLQLVWLTVLSMIGRSANRSHDPVQ